MGYDYSSFCELFDNLPKFPEGSSGKQVVRYYMEIEASRAPVEAFIGLKIESIITKICTRPRKYISLYHEYKEIAKIIDRVYNSTNLP